MKQILIVGDGMADEAQAALGGATPLEYARTPAMDELARGGSCGLLQSVPAGYAPGSEVAMLSLLGYDPAGVLEGRGVLEALGTNVPLHEDDLVLRCNLVGLDACGRMLSHSAGGIGPEEGRELIVFLQEHLGGKGLHFHPGLGYRHTLVIPGGNKALRCTPPQDIRGRRADDYPVEACRPEAEATALKLNKLSAASRMLLPNHPVNLRRRAAALPEAHAAWFWSPGHPPRMADLGQKYGFSRGAVVAGVPLVRGIGACAGLRMIDVPGATGYWDTDYAGKAAAAIRALQSDDFVLLHVEAPDECSHEGDLQRKINAIEQLDRHIVGPVARALQNGSEPWTLGLLSDHPSLCRTRAHSNEAVPWLLCGTNIRPDSVSRYDEISARGVVSGTLHQDEFIRRFFGL